MNELNISVTFKPDIEREVSDRELLVRNIFGLPPETKEIELLKEFIFSPSQIVYITGFSGSGKSSILREIHSKYPDSKSSASITIPNKAVIDCIEGDNKTVIQWLSRFGLGEAGVLVTSEKKLSEGQRERLKLALLLWSKPEVIIIDEFLSKLDRVTARIIAFQTQKVLRKYKIQAFFATAHNDLADCLLSDQIIEMDFLGELKLTKPTWKKMTISEFDELSVEDGSIEDFYALKRFHYMDRQIGDDSIEDTVTGISKVSFRNRIVGVRVYSRPYPKSFEKIKIFQLINKKISISSRVVVHPSFRGFGVSKLLTRAPRGIAPFICTHSALEKYFPFDLASGFLKTEHPSEVKTELHQTLEQLLKKIGLDRPDHLNDFKLAADFFDKITTNQKEELRTIVVAILADYDFRLAKYYLNIIGLKISDKVEDSIYNFFKTSAKQTKLSLLPRLLTEAFFFPMQGLVKKNLGFGEKSQY